MALHTLLPDPELVAVEHLATEPDSVTIVVSARRDTAPCPDCQHPAGRVHSRYSRTLGDQPWNGLRVRIQLRTRRWFCDRPTCSREIFTDRLPGLAGRYARRTNAQARVLQFVAYVLGGEAGARTAGELGMPVSPDTLLRQLRRRGPFRGPAPRVLGVDDFAFLRGRRYGTILVDLENNVPVELLQDRSAETLAKWLREHPGAEIISRDRSSSYAEGIRQGAPEATEVADRWHLLRNLSEALGDVLAREHVALREAAVEPCSEEPDRDPSLTPPEETEAPPERWDRRSERERDRSAQSRERRLALYQQVIQLQADGLTERQIAKRLGISRTTVGKYLAAGAFPERKERASPAGSLDRYAEYLRRRWNEGCRNTKQLWRELQEQGFEGKATAVWRYTWRWRPARNKRAAKAARDESVPANPPPRSVVWWLLCADRRTEAQAAFVERLEAHSSKIRLAHELVAEFFALVRERRADDLQAWAERAEATEIPDLVSFCKGVRRDWEAVKAGLTLEWSNGPVEGQVNRLKLIKRQMYGRASFRLLRARVLRPG